MKASRRVHRNLLPIKINKYGSLQVPDLLSEIDLVQIHEHVGNSYPLLQPPRIFSALQPIFKGAVSADLLLRLYLGSQNFYPLVTLLRQIVLPQTVKLLITPLA